VRIERAVLDAPHQFGRAISAIVDCFERGKHRWVIDDLEDILSSVWIQSAASWDASKELAEKLFREALDEPTRQAPARLVVVAVAAAQAMAAAADVFICSVEDARRILDHPLHVVLENATSDWCFLRALVAAFGRTRLSDAIARSWVVPDQAGGSGELVKRVRALTEQGQAPWRIAVLMDSDCLGPGPLPATLPAATNDRERELRRMGATPIVLHKREVENYLPGSLLDSKRTHDVYVSWRSLSREQQDYYDMKHGFSRDPRTGEVVVAEAQRELFAGANPWHLGRLVGGFGKSIGERFDGAQIDRAELDAVCATHPGELERLLQTLEDLL
jgi:hypothetical protein